LTSWVVDTVVDTVNTFDTVNTVDTDYTMTLLTVSTAQYIKVNSQQ